MSCRISFLGSEMEMTEKCLGPLPLPHIVVPGPIARPVPSCCPIPIDVAEVHILKLDAPSLQVQLCGIHCILHLMDGDAASAPGQGRGVMPGSGLRRGPPTSCSSWKSSNMFSMSTKEFWIILEGGKDQRGGFGEHTLPHTHQAPHNPTLPVVGAEPVERRVELDDVGAKKDKIPHLEGPGDTCPSHAAPGLSPRRGCPADTALPAASPR